MKLPLFIANRYIHSKTDSKLISLISAITIVGIAIGVAVLIIALTILDGFENTVREKITNFNSHIVVSGFSGKNLPDNPIIIKEIENQLNPYCEEITPYISKNCIIRSKQNSEGIVVTGVTEKYHESELKKYITAGEMSFEEKDGLAGILIGETLAEKLLLKVDDKVLIFSLKGDKMPTFNNPPAIQQYRVSGIYKSGMAEYDDMKAYVSFKEAGTLIDNSHIISGYNIKLNDITKIDSLSNSLQDYFSYPYYARSVFQQFQHIFTWLELQRKPIPLILGLIILVAVFNIVGTILMIVLERTQAIGILKSMGARRNQILQIFVIQGVYLSFIGIVIGNALAFLLSWLQISFELVSLPASVYYLSTVPITIDPWNYLIVSVIAFALSVVSAFIPSYIAAKIQPLSAIRFD